MSLKKTNVKSLLAKRERVETLDSANDEQQNAHRRRLYETSHAGGNGAHGSESLFRLQSFVDESRDLLFSICTPSSKHSLLARAVAFFDGKECYLRLIMNAVAKNLDGFNPKEFDVKFDNNGTLIACERVTYCDAFLKKYGDLINHMERLPLPTTERLVSQLIVDAEIDRCFPVLQEYVPKMIEQQLLRHSTPVEQWRLACPSTLDRGDFLPFQLRNLERYQQSEPFEGPRVDAFSIDCDALDWGAVDYQFSYVVALLTIKNDLPTGWLPLVRVQHNGDSLPFLCFASPPSAPQNYFVASSENAKNTLVGKVFLRFTRFGRGLYAGFNFAWTSSTMIKSSLIAPSEGRLARPKRSAAICENLCAQLARIAQDYVERDEMLHNAAPAFMGKVAAKRRNLLVTALLFTPNSLLYDAFGKLYHLPFAGDMARVGFKFVPSFIALQDASRHQRAAVLFSAARLVYMLNFDRSLDADFVEKSSATSYAQWCTEIKASAFPPLDAFGRTTSVALVNWLMMCLTNKIATGDIGAHIAFVAPSTTQVSMPLVNRSSILAEQANRFYELFNAIRRTSDDPFNCIVNKSYIVSDPLLDLYTQRELTVEQTRVVNLAIRVKNTILNVIEEHKALPTAFNLQFTYAEQAAHGLGVSREIVLLVFEGVKLWSVFKFDEEEDMLCLAPGVTTGSYLLSSVMTFLFSLVYWCAYNSTMVPYLLSPRILEHMFGLQSFTSATETINIWAKRRPLAARGLLDALDDTEKLEEIGADAYSSSVQEILAMAKRDDNIAVAADATSVPNHIKFFATFARLVRACFVDAEGLMLALSHRVYGPDGGRIPVTRDIVIACLSFKERFNQWELNIELAPPDRLMSLAAVVDAMHDGKEEKLTLFEYLRVAEMTVEEQKRNANAGNDTDAEWIIACSELLEAARKRTYLYLLRWVYEASPDTLARFWKILHGFTMTVRTGLHVRALDPLPSSFRDDVIAPFPDGELESPVRLETTGLKYWVRSGVPRPLRQLAIEAALRRSALEKYPYNNLHHESKGHAVNVIFRTPFHDRGAHMAPRYASCFSQVSVSTAHENYASFAMAMDASLSGDTENFSLAV